MRHRSHWRSAVASALTVKTRPPNSIVRWSAGRFVVGHVDVRHAQRVLAAAQDAAELLERFVLDGELLHEVHARGVDDVERVAADDDARRRLQKRIPSST